MNEQTEYVGFEASEFAENPEPRVPCILLLDVSGSMSGQRISELNEGLVTLKDTLSADSLASKRAEIAIVTFGGTVDVIQDFVTAEHFQPPRLTASGGTPMGQAIVTGLDMLASRKNTYRRTESPTSGHGRSSSPTAARTDGWQAAAEMVKQGEAAKSFAFFTVGVEGSNFDVLAKIATREPVKLKGLNFRDLFLWLSQSMQSVSQSSPGRQGVAPASPDGAKSERETIMWKLVYGSVRGTSHVQSGQPCQDHCAGSVVGPNAVAACSDGAGSAELSHLGSRRAVERFLEEATQSLGVTAPEREVIESWVDCSPRQGSGGSLRPGRGRASTRLHVPRRGRRR